nr:flavodoxin family protein [uncultured Holophaga sp.]
MRICAINGSLRGPGGVTSLLLEAMRQGVEEAGGTWDQVDLAGLRIESCRGCLCCQTEDLPGCIFDGRDACRGVFERLAAADRVVYASPIYVLGLSSALRRLLERFFSLAPVQGLRLTRGGLFFHEVDRQVCAKPFVSLLVCDNLEELTLDTGRSFFHAFSRFMEAPRLGHLERPSAAAWRRALTGPEGEARARAASILARYEDAGRELATRGRIRSGTLRAASRPFIQVPILVRLARHLPFLRTRLEAEIRKRAVMI